MIEVQIKSQDLKKILINKLKKYSEEIIYDEDLKKVKDIAINRYNLALKNTDINISELIFLTNLQSCIISNFEITDKDIMVLNNLKNLKTIQFTNCNFVNCSTVLNINVNYLIIETCKINLDIFSENKNLEKLIIIGYDKLDINTIKKFSNVKEMYLQECWISNIQNIINFAQLQHINLERSQIESLEILEKLQKIRNIRYKI